MPKSRKIQSGPYGANLARTRMVMVPSAVISPAAPVYGHLRPRIFLLRTPIKYPHFLALGNPLILPLIRLRSQADALLTIWRDS